MAYHKQTNGSADRRIAGSFHGVPCLYELELCKFRDGPPPRVEHFSSSSFADSESDEDVGASLSWQRNVALRESSKCCRRKSGLPYQEQKPRQRCEPLYCSSAPPRHIQHPHWAAHGPAAHSFSQPPSCYPLARDFCPPAPEVEADLNPSQVLCCQGDELGYHHHSSQRPLAQASATQLHTRNPAGPSLSSSSGYQDVSYNRLLTGRGRAHAGLLPVLDAGCRSRGLRGARGMTRGGSLYTQGTGPTAAWTGRFLSGEGAWSKWSMLNNGPAALPQGFRNRGQVTYGPTREQHLQDSAAEEKDGRNSRSLFHLKTYNPHVQHILEKPGMHMSGRVSVDSMPMSEKLLNFVRVVCSGRPRINDIQTIENAITGSHLNLKTQYETEDVGIYQGRRVFSGKLSLSGMFLARAVGHTKKELKHECYKLAIQVLKTKTVEDIMRQKDIGIDAIREKFEECSGHKEAGSVPEDMVSLASVAPISIACETIASREERWASFLTVVRTANLQATNSICRIEMALSGSHCGLARIYSNSNLIRLACSKSIYQGSLSIGGALQAQACGSKKKEAKLKTYDAALERFQTLDLSEIVKGIEAQNLEDTKVEGKVKHVTVKEISTPEQIKKLETFIDRIKDSSVREGPITLLDLTSNQMQLLLTLVYKRDKLRNVDDPIHVCQLYVGDILIAEGEGRHRRMAQVDAYNRAYEFLISTSVETIISENHRLESGELENPDVLDVVVKGQMRREESNLARLREQHQNVEEALSKDKSEAMVIVEHQDWIHDRKRHAFCILQSSCTMNIMLLRWCMDIDAGFFSCKVSIQGEELGSARAGTKQQARNLAAADALFKMYETHPIIRVTTFDDSQIWILYDRLLEMAQALTESELPSENNMMANVEPKSDSVGNDDKEVNLENKAEEKEKLEPSSSEAHSHMQAGDVAVLDGEGNSLMELVEGGTMQTRLRVVVSKLVKEFVERQDFTQELVFEPKVPCCVRRAVATHAAQFGLHMAQRQKEGRLYLALSFKVSMAKVAEAMKARGLTSAGRFMLVEDRSGLPAHADVAEDLELASKMTKQEWLAARSTKKQLNRSSKEVGVGVSMNGSLFEETLDGFVTAQSLLVQSLVPIHPLIQSTPTRRTNTEFIVPETSLSCIESSPKSSAGSSPKSGAGSSPKSSAGSSPKSGAGSSPKSGAGSSPKSGAGSSPKSGAGSSPKSCAGASPKCGATATATFEQAGRPASDVYTKFAAAMMASGIAQTLVPVEGVDNILINPPTPTGLGSSTPLIKNILVSPPSPDVGCVTISTPAKDIPTPPVPQLNFSLSSTPKPSKRKDGRCAVTKCGIQNLVKCVDPDFISWPSRTDMRTYSLERFEPKESFTVPPESNILMQVADPLIRSGSGQFKSGNSSSRDSGSYGDQSSKFKAMASGQVRQGEGSGHTQSQLPEDHIIQMSPASFADDSRGWAGLPFSVSLRFPVTSMYVENETAAVNCCRKRGHMFNPV